MGIILPILTLCTNCTVDSFSRDHLEIQHKVVSPKRWSPTVVGKEKGGIVCMDMYIL